MARSSLEFSDGFRSRYAQNMEGGAAAAGLASVSENFAALRRGAPNYGKMGQNAVAAAAAVERGVNDADTAALNASIDYRSAVEVAKLKADAAMDAAEKQASASKTGSVIKAGATLIGAAIMSDETTKNTIQKIDDALSTLRGLKPVTYYYNEEYSSNPERLHHGFIAQEYQTVMPDATYFDESTGKLCIDTGELIALLVRGIQQLETRVARMEAANALVGVK